MSLKIHIQAEEQWDEKKEEFIPGYSTDIVLEHSLVSLHKWEAKWHKPFLTEEEHTPEETIDYIRCMTLTQCVKDEVYSMLSPANVKAIEEYIDDGMTATTFGAELNGGGVVDRTKITAELLYYWMIQYNIPYECRKWHLNQLITLIKVCSKKAEEANNQNGKPRRLTSEELSRRDALNKARREMAHSKG